MCSKVKMELKMYECLIVYLIYSLVIVGIIFNKGE